MGDGEVQHNTRNKDLYDQIEAYNKQVSGQFDDEGAAGEQAEELTKTPVSISQIYFLGLMILQSSCLIFFLALYIAYDNEAHWASSVLTSMSNLIN